VHAAKSYPVCRLVGFSVERHSDKRRHGDSGPNACVRTGSDCARAITQDPRLNAQDFVGYSVFKDAACTLRLNAESAENSLSTYREMTGCLKCNILNAGGKIEKKDR